MNWNGWPLKFAAADVEEEIAADALERDAGERETSIEREAELDVRERGTIADERPEVVAAQRVEAAEVVEVREIAARVAGEEARRQQRARGDRMYWRASSW